MSRTVHSDFGLMYMSCLLMELIPSENGLPQLDPALRPPVWFLNYDQVKEFRGYGGW